jgi:phosphoribosyl 1,2-cyclic phosphate phosphodiesterase
MERAIWMEILFVGTGAAEGWPAVFCQCEPCQRARALGGKNIRTRSSVHIDGEYKFDFPPDTYHHVLTHGLNLADIRHLIITHSHEDHIDCDELRMRGEPFAHIFNDQGLDVYGDRWVKELEDWGELAEAGIRFHEVEAGSSYNVGKARLFPFKANHFEEKSALIYVFQKDGLNLLYGNDTGFFLEEVWDGLQRFNLDVVLLDCTHGRDDNWDNHMGISAVIKTRERMLEMGIASEETIFVATHFSHNGGLLHDELEEKLNPHGFLVAYDGMRLEIGSRG